MGAMDLHIPSAELVVHYAKEGKPSNEMFLLNKYLLDQQNCWENLEDIKEAHQLKLALYEIMENTDDVEELRSLNLDLVEIESHLQELWKFTVDVNFHRFWEYPKCICPKLDNADNYPYRKIFNGQCLLHNPSPKERAKAQQDNINKIKAKAELKRQQTLLYKLRKLVGLE